MQEKGFATIFGLCLILVIALIVKGIQESETNHAFEISSFETEQALQLAAESGIVKAAEFVRLNPNFLPTARSYYGDRKEILSDTITFKRGGENIDINIEIWGERGGIYLYEEILQGKKKVEKVTQKGNGVYFFCRASFKSPVAIKEKIFVGENYRYAYAYVFSEKSGDTWIDDTTLHFMEYP